MCECEPKVRAEVLRDLVRLLEHGGLIGIELSKHILRAEDGLLERIRTLREQLAERDLYEALYDPLPRRSVDPEWTGELDWENVPT